MPPSASPVPSHGIVMFTWNPASCCVTNSWTKVTPTPTSPRATDGPCAVPDCVKRTTLGESFFRYVERAVLAVERDQRREDRVAGAARHRIGELDFLAVGGR